jgi:small subunit ribosomal protein S6
MRTYEVIFIIRPDVPEAEAEALVEGFAQGIAATGGKVEKTEKWGKRRLAYRVQGQVEGYYVFFEVEGTGEVLQELERRLKVSEPVIKYLSVRVDVERKRVEKLRRRREHRTVRRQRKAPASAEASAGAA